MEDYQSHSYSDGGDLSKQGETQDQEILSLNWSGERAVMETTRGDCHWQQERSFIPVIKGKEGRVGPQRDVSSDMVVRRGEFCLSCFCSVSVMWEARSSTESRVWKAVCNWPVCWEFEKRQVNSDSHFGEWQHQQRIAEKWLRTPDSLECPFKVYVYKLKLKGISWQSCG